MGNALAKSIFDTDPFGDQGSAQSVFDTDPFAEDMQPGATSPTEAFGETLGMAARGALDSYPVQAAMKGMETIVPAPIARLGERVRKGVVDMLPEAGNEPDARVLGYEFNAGGTAQGAGDLAANLAVGGGVQGAVRAPLQAAAARVLPRVAGEIGKRVAPYVAESAENAIGFMSTADPNDPAKLAEYGLVGAASGPFGALARGKGSVVKRGLAALTEAGIIGAGPAALEGRAPGAGEIAMGGLAIAPQGLSAIAKLSSASRKGFAKALGVKPSDLPPSLASQEARHAAIEAARAIEPPDLPQPAREISTPGAEPRLDELNKNKPLVLWHGSPRKFDKFEHGKRFDGFQSFDVGFHFGTEEQAYNRLVNISHGQGYIQKYNVDIKKPARINDVDAFTSPDFVADELLKRGHIGQNEYREIIDSPLNTEGRFELTRNILRRRGYDGLVYSNAKEGTGDTYVAFDNSQIKLVNDEPISPPVPQRDSPPATAQDQAAPVLDVPVESPAVRQGTKGKGAGGRGEFITEHNSALESFRTTMQKAGIRPPQGLTHEDFGKRFPPGYIRKDGRYTWDQSLQEAASLGLIRSDAGPDEFRNLFSGKVTRKVQVLPDAQTNIDNVPQMGKFEIQESEMDVGDLVYRNGEWHRVNNATDEGLVLKDGEETTVGYDRSIEGNAIIKPDMGEYEYALAEFRKQESKRNPVPTEEAQSELFRQDVRLVPDAESAIKLYGSKDNAVLSLRRQREVLVQEGRSTTAVDGLIANLEAKPKASYEDTINAEATRTPDAQEGAREESPPVPPSEPPPVPPSGDSGKPIGRPDLANPATSPEARAFVDAVDEQRNELGLPVEKPNSERDAAAAKLLEDRDAVRRTVLDKGRNRGQLTDEETKAAHAVIEEDTLPVALGNADKQSRRNAIELNNAYRNTGTEQARGLSARQDPSMTPVQRAKAAIADAVTELPPKVRNEINKYDGEIAAIEKEFPEAVKQQPPVETPQPKRGKRAPKAPKMDIGAMVDAVIAEESKLASAASKIGKAAESAVEAAKAFAKGSGRLGIVPEPVFSREAYYRVKPHLDEVWKNTVGAGKDIVEFVRESVRKFGADIKPYLVHYNPEKKLRTATKRATPEAAADRAMKRRQYLLAKREMLMEKSVAESEKLSAALKDAGFNMDNIDAELANPRRNAEIRRILSTHKAGKSDVVFEVWRNNILSAIVSHSRNLGGTWGTIVYENALKRPLQALANLAIKDPDAPTFSEMGDVFKGIMPGLRKGARYALEAFQTEQPSFEKDIRGTGAEHHTQLEQNVAIKGKTGRVVRTPQRLLQAEDEFNKSLIASMHVGAHARRAGIKKGLSGDALTEFIAKQVDDTNSEAWHKAVDDSIRMTFQSDLGRFGKAAMELRSKVPYNILGYPFPFIKTPANIFKMGVRVSPLGALNPNLWREVKDFRKAGHSKAKAVELATEQVIAWSFLAGFVSLLEDDEGVPRMTGSTPFNIYNKGQRELGYRYIPAQSIRVGNKTFNYGGIEPFATAIALTIDSVNTVQDALRGKSMSNVAKDGSAKFFSMVRDKTAMRGFSELMNVFDGGADQWLGNMAPSVIPNLVRNTARQQDTKFRESTAYGEGVDYYKRYGKKIAYQMLPLSGVAEGLGLKPKVDVWGREATKDKGVSSATDFVYRVLSPVTTKDIGERSKIENDLDSMLSRWAAMHPNEKYYPETPDKYYVKNGKKIWWSEKQYHDYSKIAGEKALAKLRARSLNFDNPTQKDIDKVRKALEEARKQARETMATRN